MGARQGQQYLPQSTPPPFLLAAMMALVIPQPHERSRGRLKGHCGGCRTQTKPHYQHPSRGYKPHFLPKGSQRASGPF